MVWPLARISVVFVAALCGLLMKFYRPYSSLSSLVRGRSCDESLPCALRIDTHIYLLYIPPGVFDYSARALLITATNDLNRTYFTMQP